MIHPSTLFFFTSLLAASGIHAQIADPGFESSGATWHTTCSVAAYVENTSDTPPWGGTNVLAMPVNGFTEDYCLSESGTLPFYYEELFGYPNGTTIVFSFWAKALVDQPGQGPLSYATIFGKMTSVNTFVYDGNSPTAYVSGDLTSAWSYHEMSHTVSGLQPWEPLAILIGGRSFSGGSGTVLFDNLMVRGVGSGATLSAAAWLDGPYNTGTGLMNDGLRVNGLVPLSEPYSAVFGGPGGEAVSPAVLAVTGNNAIVDWVRLELRSNPTAATPVAVRHALIQRDGDIVATDGSSPVSFPTGPGNYYITLRHRNHLGVITASPRPITTTPAVLNFRSPGTPVHGTNARRTVNSVMTLWSGDANGNGAVKYSGSSNDRDPILIAVGSTTPNASITGQYRREDVNMDGAVRYTGSGNDRDPILLNVGSTTPNAVRVQQLP